MTMCRLNLPIYIHSAHSAHSLNGVPVGNNKLYTTSAHAIALHLTVDKINRNCSNTIMALLYHSDIVSSAVAVTESSLFGSFIYCCTYLVTVRPKSPKSFIFIRLCRFRFSISFLHHRRHLDLALSLSPLAFLNVPFVFEF